jgi:uncharacterized pyridoxal phosphate-containing UPF0001 family protein
MDANEVAEVLAKSHELTCIRLRGMMGMASFTLNEEKVRDEFRYLKRLYDSCTASVPDPAHWNTLSMGMSGDYTTAIEEGSNMVRVGSLLFGVRDM